MFYKPPEQGQKEVCGNFSYTVLKTRVISVDGIDFLVQQQAKDFSTYSYHYAVVRGRITEQFQRKNGKGPETVYCLEPADPKYKPDLESAIRKSNFKGHLEFSQFSQ
jgi:hypothetical protein